MCALLMISGAKIRASLSCLLSCVLTLNPLSQASSNIKLFLVWCHTSVSFNASRFAAGYMHSMNQTCSPYSDHTWWLSSFFISCMYTSRFHRTFSLTLGKNWWEWFYRYLPSRFYLGALLLATVSEYISVTCFYPSIQLIHSINNHHSTKPI